MKLKKYSGNIFGSLLILFSCFTAVIHSQTMEEIGKAAEWQINLPWAWQFNHCGCRWGYANCYEFPKDTSTHPTSPQDILWHRFMQRLIQGSQEYYLPNRLNDLHAYLLNQGNVCFLSDYQNVIHRFKSVLRKRQAENMASGTEEFGKWWKKHRPNPRGVPPSVIEAEISSPGSTGIRLVLNENGDVITVIPGGL